MKPDWKECLRTALRTAKQLVEHGLIDSEEQSRYEAVLARFPMVLPLYYAGLIDRNDPHCPIRLQAVPQLEELTDQEGTSTDPLADLAHRPVSRITHRYANRALIHLTPNCSMNCRYCFRKSLLAEDREEFFEGHVETAIAYLEKTKEIEEVIFSGGDPFLANENTLRATLQRLRSISHVRRVRFHTRVPVTLPYRVNQEFSELLLEHGKSSVVVTHFNHPKEITPAASQCLGLLKNAGHSLLNQSVLLSGVNANAAVLKKLSETLFERGVLPYYLHHPDRAAGTSAFQISKDTGRAIHHELKRLLPGYLVPRYVVDDPDFEYKQEV